MPADDPALEALLQRHFAPLARPGRWSLATFACAPARRGRWFSDATSSSAFHIGSVTKTFTALALASSSVAGRLDLSDRLDASFAPAAGSAVRLVDLAAHTSGYPRIPLGIQRQFLAHPGDPYSRITDRDVDREVARRRGRSVTHEYRYSNFGYGVLGRALAEQAASTYFDVVRAAVLAPLGLRETTLDLEPGADRVAGHDTTGRRVADWHNPALAGCGCLWSTIDDMERYVRANLRPGETSMADALRLAQAPRAPAGAGRQVGLGWIVSQVGPAPVVWHNGGTSGFGAFVGFDAAAGTGVGALIGRAHGDDVDRAAMAVLADLRSGSADSGRIAP